jgi:hypothetical protein
MSRPASTRLKVNPPLGTLPVLQYCQPDQLLIDETYQRSLEISASQTLIRKIAVHWDWGLCQPLFVARRSDGQLYVVDGQHRLEAAKLRGDIWQLPCVVTTFTSPEEEAAAFVALNQMRRPLTQLDLFKAALAAGDFEASQIALAVEEAGLKLANTTNNISMPAAHIANVGGLRKCYRTNGLQVLTASLDVLAQSFKGQVLRYAGTLFNGISAIVADEIGRNPSFVDSENFALMTEMVGGASQVDWISDISLEIAANASDNRKGAAEAVFRKAWGECTAELLDEAA